MRRRSIKKVRNHRTKSKKGTQRSQSIQKKKKTNIPKKKSNLPNVQFFMISYPGNKDSDIQSGQGYVHNTFLFESPLNGIVRTQFKPLFNIDPPWFITHKNSHKVLRNLTFYLCTNSKLNLIKTFFYAVIS